MDEETSKRIERKLDFIGGLLMGVFGAGIGIAIISSNSWGGWSAVVGGVVMVILPAYCSSKYREISGK